ncbi:MAG: serine protease inhibitor [Chloroflexi bacterium]|nr:serine protease inhibitor [Chloroflexota bacterium]
MSDLVQRPATRYSRGTVIRNGLLAAGGLSAGLALQGGWPAKAFGTSVEAAASRPSQGASDALLAANLDFGFRLNAALTRNGGASQNLFFSPLSISTALAMAYNGATGPTLQAMATALGLKTLKPADVNHATLGVLTNLRGRDPKVKLSIADSLWVRHGLPVLPAFSSALQTYYGAGLQSLDFKDPQAPATINAWVKQQTHGLIPSIVKSIDPTTVMYLINTLYFKAAWTSQFEARSTRPGAFKTGSGQQKTLPMMSQSGNFSYMKSDSFEAIRLPYASGKISMYVVLPAETSNLQSLLGGLNAKSWTTLVAGLKQRHGSIQMPRFSVDFQSSLKQSLSALGMGLAFDRNNATFTAMIQDQRAYITDVKHRAIMKVDESGTLAAAVTSVGIGVTAIQVDAFTMVVNRPFFCAIRDDVTGTLLFVGAVANPS